MGILISGMDEAGCRDYIGPDAWARHQIRWLAPEALAVDTCGDHQLIWCYIAPWRMPDSSSLAGSQAALARWLENNRAILNMRRQLADRLTLVNVDRVPQIVLHARLNGVASPEAATNTNTTEAATADAHPWRAQTALLGLLFERAAPQYWDVLEALEAAAWLPSGEPLVRSAAEIEESALFAVFDSLQQSRRIRAQQDTQTKALQDQLELLQQAARRHDAEQHKLQQEKQELERESELLLLQLHQVQEELERCHLRDIDMSKVSAKDKQAFADAQHTHKALHVQLGQMQDEPKHPRAMQPPQKTASKEHDGTAKSSRTTSNNGAYAGESALARLLPGRIRHRLRRAKDRKIQLAQLEDLRQSGWFDAQWYLEEYSDIRAAKVDPVEHYFSHGWKENRNPNADFDTTYYLRTNPDVAHSGLNPLWHFIHYGHKEGRLPRKP